MAALTDDSFLAFFAIRVMIFAIAAISLALILGFGATGQFRPRRLSGLGAYTVGILAEHGISDMLYQSAIGASGERLDLRL